MVEHGSNSLVQCSFYTHDISTTDRQHSLHLPRTRP